MSANNQTTGQSRRGGRRPGAGRPKKGATKPSSLAGLDLVASLSAPPPDEIDGVAQRHARTAIDALVKQLVYGASEAAKVSAANAILDRGYGKPAVEIGGDAAMLPFMSSPSVQVSLSSEIRTAARQYANLAIEVLHKIAGSGVSESARVSASKSLLDRGLGTVAAARMPDEMRARPLGKKEEAAAAAKTAGTGRYATPAPPKILTDTIQ